MDHGSRIAAMPDASAIVYMYKYVCEWIYLFV